MTSCSILYGLMTAEYNGIPLKNVRLVAQRTRHVEAIGLAAEPARSKSTRSAHTGKVQ